MTVSKNFNYQLADLKQNNANAIDPNGFTNFSKLGHPVAKWANVKSVIWLHSSRSIRSKYLQFCETVTKKYFINKLDICIYTKLQMQLTFPNAWKPKSVNWWQPATSSVFNSGLCWASDVSVWSVSSTHFDTHSFCRFKHVSLIFWMDTSVILWDWWKRCEQKKIFYTY